MYFVTFLGIDRNPDLWVHTGIKDLETGVGMHNKGFYNTQNKQTKERG